MFGMDWRADGKNDGVNKENMMISPKAKTNQTKTPHKQASGDESRKMRRMQTMDKADAIGKTLPSYVQPYLRAIRTEYQPTTLVAYARDLQTFFQFLMDTGRTMDAETIKDIPVEAVDGLTIDGVMEYKNYLMHHSGEHPHENQRSGVKRRMSPLRGFYAYANEIGLLSHNPTVGSAVARGRGLPEREIIYLEPDEATRLISTAEHANLPTKKQSAYAQNTRLRDTAILTLLLNTGIRVSECVGLDHGDINMEVGSILIHRKGGKTQTLYLNQDTITALSAYILEERPKYAQPKEQALFLSIQKQRMQVRAMEYMVSKYASASVPGKHLSPHKLRSTYGTTLYDATGDIRLVADVLGHNSMDTTAKHYAASKERHRKDAGRMNLYTAPKS